MVLIRLCCSLVLFFKSNRSVASFDALVNIKLNKCCPHLPMFEKNRILYILYGITTEIKYHRTRRINRRKSTIRLPFYWALPGFYQPLLLMFINSEVNCQQFFCFFILTFWRRWIECFILTQWATDLPSFVTFTWKGNIHVIG